MKSPVRSLISMIMALAVVSCYSLPAYAWGESGHRIVAAIAEQRIRPETRLRITQILGPGVSLASVANWADDERDNRPETYNFHFVDIPINVNVYNPNKYCKPTQRGDCVLAALPRFRNQIWSFNSTAQVRQDALKFIVHLIGDMHQPLHCAERNHDGGGGGQHVSWFGNGTNLHSVWDSGIIMKTQLSEPGFVTHLLTGVTPQQAFQIGQGNILRWALESHDVARDFAYDLPFNNQLGNDYYQHNLAVVDQQLLRGGIRLARVLDWLFAPHNGPNSVDPFLMN